MLLQQATTEVQGEWEDGANDFLLMQQRDDLAKNGHARFGNMTLENAMPYIGMAGTEDELPGLITEAHTTFMQKCDADSRADTALIVGTVGTFVLAGLELWMSQGGKMSLAMHDALLASAALPVISTGIHKIVQALGFNHAMKAHTDLENQKEEAPYLKIAMQRLQSGNADELKSFESEAEFIIQQSARPPEERELLCIEFCNNAANHRHEQLSRSTAYEAFA